MTIMLPIEQWEALVADSERYQSESVAADYESALDEPEPILEHHFTPYWPWEGLNSICGHDGCGTSYLNQVHLV